MESIDWDDYEFEEVVEINYWKCLLQEFEELFSKNTDGILPKFL